jgi:hypothetical protein
LTPGLSQGIRQKPENFILRSGHVFNFLLLGNPVEAVYIPEKDGKKEDYGGKDEYHIQLFIWNEFRKHQSVMHERGFVTGTEVSFNRVLNDFRLQTLCIIYPVTLWA